ncbi:MAG: Sll0314/Alr1548 family TPR repeat-containing protein [Xenococcaceae cyanobacterium MO_207.B15]|nr:Sll0314/Alr1548 family TPR repeat-containing protein [Xenococcaceae cyanobacterium MO_207.B15]
MKKLSLFKIFSQSYFIVTLVFTTILGVVEPGLAEDPFRTSNPRNIGEHTETAFKTLFFMGDYKGTEAFLKLAESEEPDEPLSYALRGSLAFTEEDWETLKIYADKTLEAAKNLRKKDPVRGNLYLAVGHFLDGTYIYEKDSVFAAINKLQLVFQYLDAAEDLAPNDPELNLIKGYMDLLLAVNLPFSSAEQAIARFEAYAAPNYLVDRGLAVAYRDLKQYDQALEFAQKALDKAPNNPEHYYLKAQILRKIGKKQNSITILEDALKHFNVALSKSEQLPRFIVKPLEREKRQTEAKIAEIKAETNSQLRDEG